MTPKKTHAYIPLPSFRRIFLLFWVVFIDPGSSKRPRRGLFESEGENANFKKSGRSNASIYAGVGTTTFFGQKVAPSVGIIVTVACTNSLFCSVSANENHLDF